MRRVVRLPGTLAHAARNGWAHFVGGGVEPAHPSAVEVVSEVPHAALLRFAGPGVGDPILLVPPPAAPIACFDLRPGQSLAAFLVEQTGRPVYVVDYGPIGFEDRRLGFEAWIDGILPMTIQQVSYRHGGAPVDAVAWSVGGTLTLLTAAAHPRLPLRAIAAVGTPIDYARVPSVAALRKVDAITGGHGVHLVTRALGGQPAWLVRAAFRSTSLQRELTKPWYVVSNLHDAEALARLEAVDRFIDGMPGYPGRLYGQLHDRAIRRNELASGQLTLGERVIKLAGVRQHVLIVAGRDDATAPVAAAKAALAVLTGARSLNYAEAPGSHLGVLTGPEARTTTWLAIHEFLDRAAARLP